MDTDRCPGLQNRATSADKHSRLLRLEGSAADTMVDDLDDLFSTPRARDDNDLSTDGIESFFEGRPDDSLEIHDADVLFETGTDRADLLAVPDGVPPPTNGQGAIDPSAPLAPVVDGSIADMLAALVEDLHRLADDIHRMIGD